MVLLGRGSCQRRRLCNFCRYEELIEYRLPACGVDKTCTIIDLKGLGLKQFTPQVKNMMQVMLRVGHLYA